MVNRRLLKRTCQRENYRIVVEIMNSGATQYLVEFKEPLFTHDTFGLPKINLLYRWRPCVEYISTHRKVMECLKKAGYINVNKTSKEECQKFIDQELQRQSLQYGNLIKTRKIL